MWAPLEANDAIGNTVWLVAHTVTNRVIGIGAKKFEVMRFDTERDAQIVCDALSRASYR